MEGSGTIPILIQFKSIKNESTRQVKPGRVIPYLN